MLTAIFNFIIQVFFWLCGVIGSIIIFPIQLIIVGIIPGMGDAIASTLNFFTNQVFPMLSFVKEFVLDLSCMPRPIFALLTTFLLTKWAIAPAVRSIIFIINTYRLFRGGVTINLSHGEKNVRF